jgi:hypothetical protein
VEAKFNGPKDLASACCGFDRPLTFINLPLDWNRTCYFQWEEGIPNYTQGNLKHSLM